MSFTFTKLFSSITDSSIWAADDHTRLAWVTMLAMADRRGRVWASIPGLANRARIPLDAAERALAVFTSPDPYSRTADHDGRRIEKIDGGWRLLNYQKYRDTRDEEEVRIQAAERKRKQRSHTMSQNVTRCHDNAEAEAEAEADIEIDITRACEPKLEKAKRFVPPELDEVKLAADKIGLPHDQVEVFHAFYSSKGWKVGSSPMKSWPHALTGWKVRWEGQGGRSAPRGSQTPARASLVPDHSKDFFHGTGIEQKTQLGD